VGSPSKPEIETVAASGAGDRDLAEEITALINRVYLEAEEGLWVDGAARTTTREVAETVASGQITVARIDGQIVGSVRTQQLDGGIGEFGMLVAHPGHRGKGIGRELVRFAEGQSRGRGLEVMQLELLVPREWKHPNKEFLHAWYTRIGYRPVRTGEIEESYPQLAPSLATPCDFVTYQKPL
jgi:GNAT superfamily N-acetyltransferase